ncbi:MAG: hypothetical protein IAE97_04925 [Chthoniobacterales bacterium]|nr:hypothetical protein [Chthoniobacterales bacterium]
MNWLLSLLASLICGIVGLFTSGVVAAFYADWYHMSTREGQAGFFVIGMALLGGIVCCVLGLVVARFLGTASASRFFRASGVACAAVVAMGGATTLVLFLLADFPPTIDREKLMLEMEILLPKGQGIPASGIPPETQFVLGSVVDGTQRASEYGQLRLEEAREENGRWIVPAEAFLFTSRGKRTTEARIGDVMIGAFLVPLPAHPGAEYEAWSEWMPRSPAGDPPWPDTKSSFRFRVRRIPPPAPPPTAEEVEAQKDREEQAAFDAIAPDAPLAELLPYTPAWQDAGRREAAIVRITSHPNHAKELGKLMLSPDMRAAESALRFVGDLPSPDPALVPEVRAAGRDVIKRMEKFNAATVEEDPSYEGAADISIRFGSWMSAIRALKDKAGADFTPELAEILELSRVRTDSYVMQEDVRRVASYYMKSWAGVEPLPGDPPPR